MNTKYYVITPNGVVSSTRLAIINKKLNCKLEEMEMQSCGKDKVIKLDVGDLDFVQDKKRLSMIPISNLYKADNSKWFLIAVLVFQFISMIKP